MTTPTPKDTPPFDPPVFCSGIERDCKHGQLARSCNICELERDLAAAQEARDQVLAIARELARLATCMDAIPQGSIGTQVDKLRLLEERIARETEFDNAMRNE